MFLDHNGTTLNEHDLDVLKGMIKNLTAGFEVSFEEGKKYAQSDEYIDLIINGITTAGAKMIQNIRQAQDSDEIFNFEEFYKKEIQSFYKEIDDTLDKNARDYSKFEVNLGRQILKAFGEKPDERDTVEGVEKSMSSFKLPTKPFPGLKNLEPYDPATSDISSLSSVRKANSNTYEGHADLQTEEAKQAESGYKDAIEFTKQQATRLMQADSVQFSDVYDIFSSINRMLRPGDKDGGHVRVDTPSAGAIVGISAVTVPIAGYRFFNKVAEQMNIIKQTQDPLLKKSQAIQLASFAYQMAVSEHIFADGNGRTCRMFADTILQSFGLPPHTPNIALIDTGATIGNVLDYDKGAQLFMEGIKVSNEIMTLNKQNEGPELDNRAKEYLAAEHINEKVFKELGAKEAISIAVQQRENKFSFCDALDDFIKADHFGTNNSREYKDIIKEAKAVKKILQTEATNTSKAKAVFDRLHKSIHNYEKHCKQKPRTDKTRAARLKHAHALGTALFYTTTLDIRISKIQSRDMLAQNEANHKQIMQDIQDHRINANEGLAKIVLCNLIAENYNMETPKLTVDQCEKLMAMDPAVIDRIAKDPSLQTTITNVVKKGGMDNMSPEQQIEHIAKRYRIDKAREFDKKQLQAQKLGKEAEVKDDREKFIGIK